MRSQNHRCQTQLLLHTIFFIIIICFSFAFDIRYLLSGEYFICFILFESTRKIEFEVEFRAFWMPYRGVQLKLKKTRKKKQNINWKAFDRRVHNCLCIMIFNLIVSMIPYANMIIFRALPWKQQQQIKCNDVTCRIWNTVSPPNVCSLIDTTSRFVVWKKKRRKKPSNKQKWAIFRFYFKPRTTNMVLIIFCLIQTFQIQFILLWICVRVYVRKYFRFHFECIRFRISFGSNKSLNECMFDACLYAVE